jgi:hypothetical protein
MLELGGDLTDFRDADRPERSAAIVLIAWGPHLRPIRLSPS